MSNGERARVGRSYLASQSTPSLCQVLEQKESGSSTSTSQTPTSHTDGSDSETASDDSSSGDLQVDDRGSGGQGITATATAHQAPPGPSTSSAAGGGGGGKNGGSHSGSGRSHKRKATGGGGKKSKKAATAGRCSQQMGKLCTEIKDRLEFAENADPSGPGLCGLLLAFLSLMLVLATIPFSLYLCVKVVQEYERAVIFRLGRLLKGGAKGPGIFFILPCIDTYKKVDLRTRSFDVPPQEILSRDSVTVTVDAVVYYRVSNPTMATNNVEDYGHSTHLLGATTLRNVLGTKCLAEILSEREQIADWMQSTLDEATDPWGVKVERVEIKDVRLPVQLQRAMAAEAEAAREARAKVIAAEGEQKASRALREASAIIAESSSALQLRYLQTLNSISAEKNSTIVFPVPLDFLGLFLDRKKSAKKDQDH